MLCSSRLFKIIKKYPIGLCVLDPVASAHKKWTVAGLENLVLANCSTQPELWRRAWAAAAFDGLFSYQELATRRRICDGLKAKHETEQKHCPTSVVSQASNLGQIGFSTSQVAILSLRDKSQRSQVHRQRVAREEGHRNPSRTTAKAKP